MCEQNTLSKLYGNLPQTSSLWHRADRGTTRSARDPSGTTRLRTCPQDDIVFRAGGFAPCTPIREREHRCLTIIVQFDILFFHKQVCQQSDFRVSENFLNSALFTLHLSEQCCSDNSRVVSEGGDADVCLFDDASAVCFGSYKGNEGCK